MAHPMKGDVQKSTAAKLRQVVTDVPKPSDPWIKAERISGASPTTMPNPPEEAVPQFQEDRSIRDVPYGSKVGG